MDTIEVTYVVWEMHKDLYPNTIWDDSLVNLFELIDKSIIDYIGSNFKYETLALKHSAREESDYGWNPPTVIVLIADERWDRIEEAIQKIMMRCIVDDLTWQVYANTQIREEALDKIRKHRRAWEALYGEKQEIRS